MRTPCHQPQDGIRTGHPGRKSPGAYLGHGAAGENPGVATDSELIGRDSELARWRGLVDPPPAESRVLVLHLRDSSFPYVVPA